ncbi:hypothetical protein [Dyadobacter diqingensis]|uniref:hypothetical protein n=1 Tax=Dyadobacter diqingensis TaxID=2938121 RepID=UPI0020C195A9|nr:hypothetical protein [Dyadobacter diqingensis]
MEKNRDERNAILAKYSTADTGSPNLSPITDPGDQAQYDQLAKDMAVLQEQSNYAKEALGISDILDFLTAMDGCYEGWKAQTRGIVPGCLWDSRDVVSPYMAGFVDRGWEMASGGDVKALIGSFDYMYCAYNWLARKVQRQISLGACRDMSEDEARQIRDKT